MRHLETVIHLISLFTRHKVSPESYHATNSPQQNAPYTFTNVGNLPTPMTHGMAMPTPPVGLRFRSSWYLDLWTQLGCTLTWTWGGWGRLGLQDPQRFPTWKRPQNKAEVVTFFFFLFQTLALFWCFFSPRFVFFRISCPKLGVLKKNLSISFV